MNKKTRQHYPIVLDRILNLEDKITTFKADLLHQDMKLLDNYAKDCLATLAINARSLERTISALLEDIEEYNQ